MNPTVLKVIQQGETYQIDSQKAESGKIAKCTIVLQELGGKFENQFVATMFGPQAEIRFCPGDVVAAKLRFQAREYTAVQGAQAQVFQDITVQEIVKL